MCITYRQTLARGIMCNFGQLGFKNYLDSYDDPSVWNVPRLIVQLNSLMTSSAAWASSSDTT